MHRSVGSALEEVAFDPQTSGGLLIAVPAKTAGQLLKKLRAEGMGAAALIGRATARRDRWVYLR